MTNEEQPSTKENARILRDDIAIAALQGMIAAKRCNVQQKFGEMGIYDG